MPAIYHALISHPSFAELDVSNVRWISYGGAPIAESLVYQIMEAFPNARVGNGFGLTETCSLTSFLPHEEADDHADSVGFAMPVCDLAIDDPDPETGVGELLVRGPNIVQGYWNKPEATAETFVDGWLHTGDLARVDADGLLYIVDRKKDMINRGGENVYSIEVENALAGAPGVGEAAVVAVPDEMMGEKVGAVIVPSAGAELDVAAVIAHCRANLADFKVPQYVAMRAEPLPRNPGGKLLKEQLREETALGQSRFADRRAGEAGWQPVQTVQGPIDAEQLGLVLAHEHVRVPRRGGGRPVARPLRRAARARCGARRRQRREGPRRAARSSMRPRCSAAATCAS